MPRLKMFALWAVVLGGLWWPLASWADKPLRIVVAFPAGGAMDSMARAVAAALANTDLGKPVVENRPGADGLIAINHVLNQVDSSATVLMVGPYFNTAQANGKLPAEKVNRFKPVVHLGDLDLHLIANHRVALKNRMDLSRPVDKPWTCAASGGQFTTVCELLARDYPGKVLSVPYRGEAQALNDLLGGHIDLMPITGKFAAQHVSAGLVTTLADLSAPPGNSQRPPTSVVFSGSIKSFYGWVATADMPQILLNQLNLEINRIIKNSSLDANASAIGLRFTGGSPSDFEAVLRDNTAVQTRLLDSGR